MVAVRRRPHVKDPFPHLVPAVGPGALPPFEDLRGNGRHVRSHEGSLPGIPARAPPPDVDSPDRARQNLPMNPRELEDKYVLRTYAKMPFSLERGERNHVFDSDGRRYLDLYG